MAVYTVSLRDTSGLGQVNVGDGTLFANLSVAAGRGPKGDGWTSVTYDENTGTFIFTSNDGLAYTSPDLRPELQTYVTAAEAAQAGAEAAETATEALFDQFGDQYLGPKASDPTVDNDGDPLTEGDIYFNTTDGVLKFYSGTAWVSPESVATTAATAAQAAQAAAETAETNAETAEANAAASETAAATSATNAGNSEAAAASSAAAASTSAGDAAASAASIDPNSIDINGGTIDGTVIGGTTPAAVTGTTLTATGAFTSLGIDDNAASTAMTLDASGNVGVGTTSSSAKLSIQTADLGTTAGDSVQAINLRTDTSNGDQMLFTTERISTGTSWDTAAHKIQRKVDVSLMGYMQFGHANSDLITFGENGVEYMRIDGSGNVGIGTSSPATELEVRTTTNTDRDAIAGLLRLTGASNNENGALIPSAGTALEFYNSWSGGNPNSVARISGRAEQGYNGGLQFDVSDNTSTGQTNYTTAMNILSNGNVGIGTDSPAEKLSVAGNATVTGAISADVVNISPSSGYGSIEMGGPSGAFIDMKSPYNDDYDARIMYDGTSANLTVTTQSATEPVVLAQGYSTKLSTSNTGVDVSGVLKASNGFIFGSTSSYLYEGAADAVVLRVGSDGPYAEFNDAGSGVLELGNAGGDLALTAYGAERMRIDGFGRVGINTSSPAQALQVQDAGTNATGTIKLGNDYHGYVQQYNNDLNIISNGDQAFRAALGTNNGSGNIVFQTANGTTGNTQRMRIDSLGRVTMPYQPCFSAWGNGLLTWSAGSTIQKIVPLTYVPHNVGGHFNASTYRFTAPVAGNYFFSAKATQTGTAIGPSLFLYKNDAAYGFEMAIGYSVAYHSFGGEAVVPLAANDYVDMRITNNNSVALNIDKNRCTLSGFLIG